MSAKVTDTTRVLVVGSGKLTSGNRKPRIRIAGFWLEEFGFCTGAVVFAQFTQGKVILTVQSDGMEAYKRCIQDLRQKGGAVIQISSQRHNNKRTPHFELVGLWMERYGFRIGDVVVLHLAPGRMSVTRLELPGP